MEAFKLWCEPLLWCMSTVLAIAAFVRFCKPIWEFFQYPKKSEAHLQAIDETLKNTCILLETNETINKKQEAIQLSLLHDAIIQIYNNAKNEGILHTAEYQRAVDLYKENGQSEYIDAVMEEMKSMWKEGQQK